jgi:hypothetical protein
MSQARPSSSHVQKNLTGAIKSVKTTQQNPFHSHEAFQYLLKPEKPNSDFKGTRNRVN